MGDSFFIFLSLLFASIAHTFIRQQGMQIDKLQNQVLELNKKVNLLEKH